MTSPQFVCYFPPVFAGVLPVQDDVGIRPYLTDTTIPPPIPPRSDSSSPTPSLPPPLPPPPLPPSLSSDASQALAIPGPDGRFVI